MMEPIKYIVKACSQLLQIATPERTGRLHPRLLYAKTYPLFMGFFLIPGQLIYLEAGSTNDDINDFTIRNFKIVIANGLTMKKTTLHILQ